MIAALSRGLYIRLNIATLSKNC